MRSSFVNADFRRCQQTEHELVRRNQELQTLFRISTVHLNAPYLGSQPFQATVKEISTVTGFPIVAIERYDEVRQMMVFEGMWGIPLPPDVAVLEVPMEQTSSGAVVRLKQPIIKHYTPDDSKQCDSNPTLRQLNIQTFVCIPMLTGDRAIGTLSLAHPRRIEVDEAQIQWLTSLANYIALLTERRQTETKLQASNEQFQLAATAIKGHIYDWNLETNAVTRTPGLVELLGFSPEETTSTSEWWIERLHPDDCSRLHALMAEALATQPGYEPEYRVRHRDGHYVYVLDHGLILRNAQGQAVRVVGNVINITERKRAEEERQQAENALRQSQQKYQRLVQSIDGIVWEFDLQTLLFSFVSDRAEQILGYPIEQWLTEPYFWENHLHPDDRDWVIAFCKNAAHQKQDVQFEYRMIAANGQVVWLQDVVSVVVENDQPVQLRGILIDITNRKQAETLLAQQLKREQFISEITQHIRQSLDLDTILETAVTEVQHILQADRALIFRLNSDRVGEVIQEAVIPQYAVTKWKHWVDECFPAACYAFYLQGRPRIITDVMADEWAACLAQYMQEINVKSKIVAPILHVNDNAITRIWGLLIVHACSHRREWQPTEAELLQQIANQLAIAIHQSELYQQLQDANRELEYLATHDKLTQVANRRAVEDSLSHEWSRLAREHAPLSLILCDIDYFKQYNDTYGHQAGDDCLRQVAQAIKQAVKRPANVVARYGGEEFIVILPNTDRLGAREVAEEICRNIRTLAIAHTHSQVSQCITVSLGVATTIPNLTQTPEHLIATADRGLYQAKAQGRDRIIVVP